MELATDLLSKDPDGVGDSNILFASNVSWLTDYILEIDPCSGDLCYLITAAENFYNHASPEQKATRTFAECARMLAVAYNHIKEVRPKIIYYQECASQCPSVKEKLDKFMGDALFQLENLLGQGLYLSELIKVAEAGFNGAKAGSDRAAKWATLVGIGCTQTGDFAKAQQHYLIAVANESVKKTASFSKLQKEIRMLEKKISGSKLQGITEFFTRLGKSKPQTA